jgi:hypothetical protein
MIYVPKAYKSSKTPWTEALVKEAIDLYSRGFPAKRISLKLGMCGSSTYIYHVLRKNGVDVRAGGIKPNPIRPDGTKLCGRCGEFKDATRFCRYKRTQSNLTSQCKDCMRKDNLRSRFGITPEDFSRMQQEQEGVCAICKQPETIKRNGHVQALSVDHCHVSGKIRKLLCSRCNHILGQIEESIDILESMITYLKENS